MVSLYLNLMISLSGILLLRHAVMLSNCTKETACTGLDSRAVFFSERVINIWNQLPESTDFRSLSWFMRNVCYTATWIYLVTCIYNFVCFMCVFSVLYNGFYVSDSTALCWATFNAFYALWSSHVMTNTGD